MHIEVYAWTLVSERFIHMEGGRDSGRAHYGDVDRGI